MRKQSKVSNSHSELRLVRTWQTLESWITLSRAAIPNALQSRIRRHRNVTTGEYDSTRNEVGLFYAGN